MGRKTEENSGQNASESFTARACEKQFGHP